MRPTFLQSVDTSRTTLILAFFILIASNALTPDISPNGDNASYIILAESLINGHGYTNTMYPGEPSETQYPPLLPALLFPILATVGKNYLFMKVILFIFGILGLVMMYQLLKDISDKDTAWVAVLLTAANANYLFFSSSILTETIYVFLSAWVLIVLRRIDQHSKDHPKTWLWAALLIALSFYARTIGATLAITACVYLFFSKRYKAAISIGILIGLMLLPWGLRSIQIHNSYFSQLTEKSAGETDTGSFIVFYRLTQNLPRYAGKVMMDLVGGPDIGRVSPYNPIKVGCSFLFSALFFFGYVRNLKTRLTLENVYVLVYLAILAVWPYHDSRFLLPILPLMFVYMFEGLKNLPGTTEKVRQHLVTWTTAFLLILGIATSLYQVIGNRTAYYRPEIANFKDACVWVQSNTPPDAVIISRKPRLAAIWAERKSWWYTDGQVIPNKDLLGNSMQASHLIVTDFPIAGVNLEEGFAVVRSANPDKYELLYRTPPPTVSVYAQHAE